MNRSKISALIVLFLLVSVSGMMTTMQISNAQTETSPIPTNALVTVSPNPVGVNQQVTILMWLVQIEPTAMFTGGGRWDGFSLLITGPDETTQSLGPFTADDASFAHAMFTPTKIGNYTVKFSFPGKHVTGMLAGFGPPVPIDVYYGASSFTATLMVQEEPVSPMPQPPIPTDYWSRPINSQNFDWYQISGNWLGTGAGGLGGSAYNASGNFNPYTTVPNTAHIVWTKPIVVGGLIGGEYGGYPHKSLLQW